MLILYLKPILTATYSYIANHFGVGVYKGEVAIAYGRYVDKFRKLEAGWRIYQRELVYMVCWGSFDG